MSDTHIRYYVRASQSAQEDGERFGPVWSREAAETLLTTISARPSIVKASIEVEVG